MPTADYGLDGNSPEIAKAIDQAVADGMNVINLSIGEPEVEPRRDIVVKALDNAAAAGVVPVVAAGNDFDVGRVRVDRLAGATRPPRSRSPPRPWGTATGRVPTTSRISRPAGPTPVSLQLKPDVTAPGVDVLSSIPRTTSSCWTGRAWRRRTSPAVLRSSSSAIRRGRCRR